MLFFPRLKGLILETNNVGDQIAGRLRDTESEPGSPNYSHSPRMRTLAMESGRQHSIFINKEAVDLETITVQRTQEEIIKLENFFHNEVERSNPFYHYSQFYRKFVWARFNEASYGRSKLTVNNRDIRYLRFSLDIDPKRSLGYGDLLDGRIIGEISPPGSPADGSENISYRIRDLDIAPTVIQIKDILQNYYVARTIGRVDEDGQPDNIEVNKIRLNFSGAENYEFPREVPLLDSRKGSNGLWKHTYRVDYQISEATPSSIVDSSDTAEARCVLSRELTSDEISNIGNYLSGTFTHVEPPERR